MCGILLTIKKTDKAIQCNEEFEEELKGLNEANNRRGPDSNSTHTIDLPLLKLSFTGTVLHLRGIQTTKQPLINDNGDILLFNGEIFGGIKVDKLENDGLVLLNQLNKCNNEDEILNLMDSLIGPYAFVYFKESINTIYLGRDRLGRRSLLTTFMNGTLIITSVTSPLTSFSNYHELDPINLYKIELDSLNLIKLIRPKLTNPHYLNVNNQIPKEDEDKKDFGQLSIEIDDQVDELFKLLNNEVKIRCLTIPKPKLNESRLAILFSGGIDCTILTLLCHLNLPENEPIDLLNVGFENLRVNQSKNNIFDVPDRKSGVEAVEELRKLCPNRKFNFVYIDVPYSEVINNKLRIVGLLKPNDTIMDESIGLAFWFASQGIGYIRTESNESVEFKSQAKVVFSGLGADEQLAGYSRHRSSFEKGSWDLLIKEIQYDLFRLHTRNLGRDDRIISDQSKETRYPYLSTNVIQYLSNLSMNLKFKPQLPKGKGDKFILRALALKLNLKVTCYRVKRAIQFGAKTAKMELGSGKKKGIDKV